MRKFQIMMKIQRNVLCQRVLQYILSAGQVILHEKYMTGPSRRLLVESSLAQTENVKQNSDLSSTVNKFLINS